MQKITFFLVLSVFFALPSLAQVNIDQIKIGTGTGNAITLESAGVSAPRTIMIPDPGPGGPASLMLSTTAGGQTINGGLTLGTPLVPASGGTGINTSATVAGSILYTNGTGTWTTLAPGSNTNVLTLASGVPTWAAGGGGGSSNIYSVGSSGLGNGATISGSSTAVVYFVNDGATINLPSASTAGQHLILIDVGFNFSVIGIIAKAQTGQAVVEPYAASNSQSSGRFESLNLISNGSGLWYLQQN